MGLRAPRVTWFSVASGVGDDENARASGAADVDGNGVRRRVREGRDGRRERSESELDSCESDWRSDIERERGRQGQFVVRGWGSVGFVSAASSSCVDVGPVQWQAREPSCPVQLLEPGAFAPQHSRGSPLEGSSFPERVNAICSSAKSHSLGP